MRVNFVQQIKKRFLSPRTAHPFSSRLIICQFILQLTCRVRIFKGCNTISLSQFLPLASAELANII